MLQSFVRSIVKDFCSYFDSSADVIGFEDDKIPEIQLKESHKTVKGFRNIISSVIRFSGKNAEENALLDQWLEYALTNAVYLYNTSNVAYILKELNEYLSDKVYFVGIKKSPADVLLYLVVYNVMLNFTFQEKEKYINVSRWFNNIQQDQKLRNERSYICFSRTRLY